VSGLPIGKPAGLCRVCPTPTFQLSLDHHFLRSHIIEREIVGTTDAASIRQLVNLWLKKKKRFLEMKLCPVEWELSGPFRFIAPHPREGVFL
jgi:hypothetical protein